MSKPTLSRRECFLLLGASAAGALGPARALAAQQQTSASNGEPLAPRATGALPIAASAWLDLETHARVYDTLTVQPRPAHTPDRAGHGSQIDLGGNWEMIECDETLPPGEVPSNGQWIAVAMPAPVQYALMEAGKIPNLWYGENFRDLQWIHQRDWFLRRRFTIPESWRGSLIRLRFDGMDYRGVVWLDGQLLGSHEGSFGGPTFDVSMQAVPGREHELLVALLHERHDPLPNFTGDSANGKPRAVKPDAEDAESYQWGNRYRTMGLYQPIRLIATGPAYFEAPFVRTDELNNGSAALWAQAIVNNTGPEFDGAIAARIIDAATGRTVWKEDLRQKIPTGFSFLDRRIVLNSPRLWWPNGLGDQPLYLLQLKLLNGTAQYDETWTRFGVRTLELRRNPSSPDRPRKIREGSTLEDEAYEYLWVANGRPFYAKGACWMTSDDVMALSPEREEWMIRAAKMNGLNLLRLNGGTSIFETEQFYDLCDEHGIVVWQEPPLNWAQSPGTTSVGVWREQLTQCAMRFRQHPSTGVYVGGNEYDPFADAVEPLVGMVREVFAGYDGKRPFRMNSPCGGDVHAYEPPEGLYAGDENWYHRIWDEGTNFISEWSFSSLANLSLLKRIIPEAELRQTPVGYDVENFKQRYPTIRDRSAELTYTFLKSWLKASWYDDLSKASIPDLIDCSQMGYARTVGCVFEQWRAQFPFTGGEALWTYNSLGPVASSWHIIDWFGQPQIPFYASKTANQPVLLFADTGFFTWGPGDTFRAKVFGLNDHETPLLAARATARILDGSLSQAQSESWNFDLPANGRRSEGHDLAWAIPRQTPEGYFFLELTLEDALGARLSRRVYPIRVLEMLADPIARAKWQSAPVQETVATHGPWLKPQIAAVPTTLEAKANLELSSSREGEVRVTLRNTGKAPAYPVRLDVLPDVYSTIWTDNFLWLRPGEELSLNGVARLDMKGLDPLLRPPIAARKDLSVRVSAWNAPAVKVQL